MLAYIYHALSTFRSVFSRHRTWVIFVMIVLGFLGATEMLGISSFCRFWGLDLNGYYRLLHFFAPPLGVSTTSSITGLCPEPTRRGHDGVTPRRHCGPYLRGEGRPPHARGAHPASGLRHPEQAFLLSRSLLGQATVHKLETSLESKPSYFRGHCWGAIGLLIGSLTTPFCLPLELRLHQGFEHLGPAHTPSRQWTLAERPVAMALAMAIQHAQPIVLILDAYVAVAPVLALAASLCPSPTQSHG